VTFNNTTGTNFFDTLATGRATSSPFVDIFMARDPTPYDITQATSINTYATQQKWLNTTTNALWELKNFVTSNGVTTANWILLAQHSLVVESLRDQTGIDVFPDATNEINVIGDGTYVITTGTPSTNTLTVSVTGAITTLYTENVGTATPMAGNLNVLGGTGVTTTGSGNTITIALSGTGAVQEIGVDTASAPGTNPVTPSSGKITITGGQVAAGTTANVIQTDSTAADGPNKFSIEVQRSQAVASSTIGDNGVSHFNSSQFSVDANGFVSITGGAGFNTIANQVFTTSGTYTPTTGMKFCSIVCLGGGGAGGGAPSTSSIEYSVSSGGGGGEYASGIFTAASIGASQAVTIGAGGTGINGATGNVGGTTSVGALISCFGGLGGVSYAAGQDLSAPGVSGGSGGSGGDFRTPGFFSESVTLVLQAPPISLGFAQGGSGANSQLGNGGSWHINGNGSNALGYGAGGGGSGNGDSMSATTGGNGSAGIVIITEYIG
jgi:hypothetical protein